MASRRKGWSNLSTGQRNRYTSAGISEADYRSGASLQAARGHAGGEGHGFDRLISRLTGPGSDKIVGVVSDTQRNPDGTIKSLTFAVTDLNGKRNEYRIGGKITDAKLKQIGAALQGSGVPLLPGYEGSPAVLAPDKPTGLGSAFGAVMANR